jgi:hypothetical protein
VSHGPDVHALQFPELSHVPPVHALPDGRIPLVVQTGMPLEHEIVPDRHGIPGLHDAPGVHAMQEPVPLHTPPEHAVPGGEFEGVHCGVPLPHWMVPV